MRPCRTGAQSLLGVAAAAFHRVPSLVAHGNEAAGVLLVVVHEAITQTEDVQSVPLSSLVGMEWCVLSLLLRRNDDVKCLRLAFFSVVSDSTRYQSTSPSRLPSLVLRYMTSASKSRTRAHSPHSGPSGSPTGHHRGRGRVGDHIARRAGPAPALGPPVCVSIPFRYPAPAPC
jgi:hypothetical protein